MGLIRTSASSYDAPDIAPGTYVMTCTGVRLVSVPLQGVDEDRLEWTFEAQSPNGIVEIDKLTGTKATPNSKTWEFLAALLGAESIHADQDFNESDVVGHSALGTMGTPLKPDGQPGKFGLVGMVPLPRGMQPQPRTNGPASIAAVAPANRPQTVRAAVGDDGDGLPF